VLSDELTNLKESAKQCDLCRLFYQSVSDADMNHGGKLQFKRIDSTMRTDSNGLPVLSIYTDPGMRRLLILYFILSATNLKINFSPRLGSLSVRAAWIPSIAGTWQLNTIHAIE
jgi:hypothetical protein